MTFSEQLNEYISKLGCTAKDLADASGLSAAVLSRYRTGSRVPEINSSLTTGNRSPASVMSAAVI